MPSSVDYAGRPSAAMIKAIMRRCPSVLYAIQHTRLVWRQSRVIGFVAGPFVALADYIDLAVMTIDDQTPESG